MNAKPDELTTLGAVGYILGLGWGLVWKYYRFFVVLFASAGFLLLLSGSSVQVTYWQPANLWTFKISDGAFIGLSFLAGSAALWFSRYESNK
ncbi:MAG: hypothetical protein ACTHLW_21815 [Verrucomicrobiota bacterium]